ncbi:hypothetical protein B0H65DRAFT_445523 [Neurospora tetraspora]|uniref:Uncharacterized protein n=1 Tax=Neurospora tetraspora TaxID=94610 RepID=A0AAE0J983_9PEZI|nr:hypothetical protein B0H65DRAFT_445523 [Neurospora tetraspora]
MVEKQPPESSRSLSPGRTPSDAGSSVQVHADNGSTSEPPLRDDLLRDLIHSYDTHLVSTASVPVSHSLKRPHDEEPTDTEPLAKRDRLIEELDQMESSGSKAAIESLQTRQTEINEHGDPVASTRAENTIPTLEGHTRVVLPIRSSTKRQTSRQQSGHTTALLEQHGHAETNSEKGT